MVRIVPATRLMVNTFRLIHQPSHLMRPPVEATFTNSKAVVARTEFRHIAHLDFYDQPRPNRRDPFTLQGALNLPGWNKSYFVAGPRLRSIFCSS